MLSKIRFVLVNPSHGGNVGAVARAIKNMGLRRLVLVAPRNHLSDEARARASGAEDVLEGAQVVEHFNEALTGATWVLGTTSRARRLDLPRYTPRAVAEAAVAECASGEVAVVFGCERTGLTNDELALCHAVVEIPANAEYASLNIAAAVQIIAYEMRLASLANSDQMAQTDSLQYVDARAMERFYEHMEQALREVGFFDVGNPQVVMRRLRRLFGRTRLDENEVNILRGFFKAVQAKAADGRR